LNAKYAKDVVFVGVSVDTNIDRLDKFVREKAISWAQLADGKEFQGPIPKLYRLNGTPTLYVLDRAGKIAAKLGSAEKVEETIQTVLAPP
jgi:thioredoxin family protein